VAVATAAGRDEEFTGFLEQAEARLRRVLIAHYGADVGREAAADALAYAWEHWDRLRHMRNPAGYLYRVGQSRARRHRTRTRALEVDPPDPNSRDPWIEPALAAALDHLSPRQRTAVLMVHGFGETYEETARAMNVSRSTVQRHVERALDRLRRDLEVGHD